LDVLFLNKNLSCLGIIHDSGTWYLFYAIFTVYKWCSICTWYLVPSHTIKNMVWTSTPPGTWYCTHT